MPASETILAAITCRGHDNRLAMKKKSNAGAQPRCPMAGKDQRQDIRRRDESVRALRWYFGRAWVTLRKVKTLQIEYECGPYEFSS
jgi:hypothetical protein